MYFLALSIEDCIAKTVTCYGSNDAFLTITYERFAFNDDGDLLQWTHIPEWCELNYPPTFAKSCEFTRALKLVATFYEIWNTDADHSEIVEFYNNFLSPNLKMTSDMISGYYLGRVIQDKIFRKEYFLRAVPFFRKRIPKIKLQSLVLTSDVERQYLFSTWCRYELIDLRGNVEQA